MTEKLGKIKRRIGMAAISPERRKAITARQVATRKLYRQERKIVLGALDEMGPELGLERETRIAAGALLLISRHGINASRIAGILQCNEARIQIMIERAIKNKIWFFGQLRVDWDHEKEGMMSFLLDVLTISGYVKCIERVKGDWMFQNTKRKSI